MSIPKCWTRWLLAGVAIPVLMFTFTSTTFGQDTLSVSAMQERLRYLEHEVADLRAQLRGDHTWLNERRAAEVKSLVRELLEDADVRASLRDDAVTAGWKNGFFISSDDGTYLLRIRGLIMARYMLSLQDDSPVDDSRGGFELARTRFGFMGHVIDPTWQYFIWTGFLDDGSASLLDVYIRKSLGDGFAVTAGQFKVPFWREWLISEARLPMIERSHLNRYSGAYAQGLMLSWESERVRAYLAYTDGLNTTNTVWSTEDTEFALTGRVEGLLWGKWEQYVENEAWDGDEAMLVVGLAAHYQEGESGTAAIEQEVTRWTADITLKQEDFNVMAAVVGNHQHDVDGADQFGVLLGAGYFLNPNVELHARYEWGDSDLDSDEDLSILTIGLDRHWSRHQVRALFDVGYAFNPMAAYWVNSMTGFRTDSADKDGQIVVRSQLQLSF